MKVIGIITGLSTEGDEVSLTIKLNPGQIDLEEQLEIIGSGVVLEF